MTATRYRPSAAYATAIRFAEDGSNWREFDGWCGWDILVEAENWYPSNPTYLPFLEICLEGDPDSEDSEWSELLPGDWVVQTDGGVRIVLNDYAFRTLFQEFE